MSDPKQTTQPPKKPSLPELIDKLQQVVLRETASAETKDPLVAVEQRSLEESKRVERLEIENERLRDELNEARELHRLRKEYTGKLYSLIVLWLIFVLIYVGLAAVPSGFKLSDSVLIAFITSTTVSVLGLFIIVAKWLFPSPHKDEVEQNKTRKNKAT